jgi:uncharacterized protein (DUF885 family)
MGCSRRLGRLALFLVVSGLTLGVASCSQHPKPTWSPPSLSEVRRTLTGLSFSEFVDTAHRLHLLRFPQTVTELGLAQSFGVRNDRLDDYSVAYLRETAAIEREILNRLHSYPRGALSTGDQATYDASETMWTALVAQQNVPTAVRIFSSGGDSANARLARRFAAVERIVSEDDIVDYIACLYQVGRQVDQIRSCLEQAARLGTLPGQSDLRVALGSMAGLRITETFSPSEYLPDHIISTHHPFFGPFRDRLVDAGIVDASARTKYLQDANRVIARQIIPAYEELAIRIARILNEMNGAT